MGPSGPPRGRRAACPRPRPVLRWRGGGGGAPGRHRGRGGHHRRGRRALRRHAGRPLWADRPVRGDGGLPRSLVGGHTGPARPGRHPAAAGGDHPGPVGRAAGGERLGPLRGGRSRLPRGGPGGERGPGRVARPRHRAPAAGGPGRGPRPGPRRPAPALPARLLRRRLRGGQPRRPLLRPGAGAPGGGGRGDGPAAGRAGSGRPVGAAALGQPRGGDGAGRCAVAGTGPPAGADRRAAGARCAPRWPTPPAMPWR